MPNDLPLADPKDLKPVQAPGGDLPLADPADLAPTGPSAMSRGVSAFAQETPFNPANLVAAAKNLPEVVKSAIGLNNGPTLQSGIDAFKRGDYATAVAHAIYSLMPMVGPSLAKAGDELASGDVASGVGRTLGVGSGFVAPEVAKGVKGIAESAPVANAADSLAGSLYRSAVKPRKGNAVRTQAALDLGRSEGVMPNDLEAAKALKQSAGQDIGSIIDNAPDVQSIKTQPVLDAVESLKKDYLASQKGGVDTALNDILDKITDPNRGGIDLTPKEAHQLKVALQDAATTAKSTAYQGTTLNSPTIEGWQTGAQKLGDQLAEQFPELKDPNARYSAASDLVKLVNDSSQRIAKHEPFGLLPTLMGGTGAFIHGGAGAIGGMVLGKLITDPVLRAKAASILSRATDGEVSPVAAASRFKMFGDMLPAPAGANSDGVYPRPSAGLSDPIEGKVVYHGTPYSFDKFDMSKVGTGEGAQAYGHGLYFAENPSVANQYQKNLANQHMDLRAAEPVSDDSYRAAGRAFRDSFDPYGTPDDVLKRMAENLDVSAKISQRYPGDKTAAENLRRATAALEDIKAGKYKIVASGSKGNTYQVELPSDIDSRALNWDKPLSEQPEALALAKQLFGDQGQPEKWTGEDFYRTLTDNRAAIQREALFSGKSNLAPMSVGAEEASMALRDAGLRGLKYLDQGSRAAKDWFGNAGEEQPPEAPRTSNYVIFDDQTPQIIKPERLAEIENEKNLPKTTADLRKLARSTPNPRLDWMRALLAARQKASNE